MPRPVEPPAPAPRRGWIPILLLVLLAGGMLASRQWIGAERRLPSATAAWRVTVLAPSGTVIHRPTTFEVEVRQPDGRPADARVEIDLTMPDMEMPLNRFAAAPVPQAPGHYRGTGAFTMKGRWQIEAIARRGEAVATGRRLVTVR